MKKVICALLSVFILLAFCSCTQGGITRELNQLIMPDLYTDWGSFSEEKPIGKGSAYKLYFDYLNSDQKKAYNNIFNNVLDAESTFPEKIEIPLMDGDGLSQVYEAVVYDNPEIMCFGKGASIITEGDLCYFKPEYTMTPEEMNEKISLLSDLSDEIQSSFTAEMSDFDKELYIHDFIVKNCTYDCEKADSNLAFSCLFNGYASCEGYAKATKYLLEKAGIECYNILGDAVNLQNVTESHMWNLVNINGSYYYLDTTWDDPSEESSHISHAYFNLTEDELRQDHNNFTAYLPCESTGANYFRKTGDFYYSVNYYDRIKMEATIVSALQNGENSVEFRFSDDSSFQNAFNTLINESKAYDIQQSIKNSYPQLNMSDEIKYSKNERFRIIEFIF